jgi:purine-binding chemotaxis protein CheW
MSVLHVVFKVGGAEYVMPAADVVQMESFTGATAIPGSPAHVRGVVQIRGKVVPLVDLRARFGLAAQEPTLDSRIVVGRHAGRSVGLLVDSAREVLKLESSQFKPPPDIVAQGANGLITSVVQLGARLLMLVNFPQVIGEE